MVMKRKLYCYDNSKRLYEDYYNNQQQQSGGNAIPVFMRC